MANKITLNSISDNVFRVNSGDATRDDIVAAGIALTYEYARNGQQAVLTAMNSREPVAPQRLNADEYKALNERFRNDMLVFAANQACAQMGRKAPANFEEFKKVAPGFRKNSTFIAVLQDIWQEILYPIIPAVYSTAVSIFADTYEVGFSETVDITIESGDIPIFQDGAWGASRSVPANRFYAKTYTMNPQPKTCEIRAKWHQIIGNNTDWGQFFANVTAGLYAKTMGMWSATSTGLRWQTSSGLSTMSASATLLLMAMPWLWRRFCLPRLRAPATPLWTPLSPPCSGPTTSAAATWVSSWAFG